MTLYELLKTIHILSIATWFGSNAAITVIGLRALKQPLGAYGPYHENAGWWAGRAHTAAGVLLLVTGLGMVGDSGVVDFGDLWIIIAIVGLVVAMGIGGAVIGPTAERLGKGIGAAGGTMTEELRPMADRLLLFSRVELAILFVVIVDMVVKPG